MYKYLHTNVFLNSLCLILGKVDVFEMCHITLQFYIEYMYKQFSRWYSTYFNNFICTYDFSFYRF